MACGKSKSPSTTMKCRTSISLILALSSWPFLNLVMAQAPPTPPVQFEVRETSDIPQALVIAVNGKCEYSEDGKTFSALKVEQVCKQGDVVRTGEGARADLFFRRIGTSVRLQAGTEMKLEKMSRQMKDGQPVMETLLDLRTGRIFTVVRSLILGSTL